jgi:hypothetical protein
MRSVSILGLLATACLIAQTSIDGPASSYLYDAPSKSIRRIIGVPGAMYMERVPLDGIDEAFVAPDGTTILCVRGSVMSIADFSPKGAGAEVQISGTDTLLNKTAWAADASAFVRYSSGGLLQRVVRTASGWNVASTDDLSHFGDDLRVLAVGPSADLLLATSKGSLLVMRKGSDIATSSEAFAAAAITKDGKAAFLVTVNGGIKRLSAGAEALEFVSGGSEPVESAGLALAANDRELVLAVRANNVIRVYDALSAELKSELTLEFKPTTVQSVSRTAYLIATPDKQGDPFWLYAEAPVRSAYFLPVGN